MRLLLFLLVCLSIMISGCVKTITVKHLNPDKPNVLESNAGVVFGRIIFITHSEERGEVKLLPLGLGLVHVETGKRALEAVILEKTVSAHPVTGDPVTHEFPRSLWVENDGTFFWVLPTGRYQIDALGWGFTRILFVSDPDLKKPKEEQIFFPLKPEKPPECGFVVNSDIAFNVAGESRILYIGSLVIDIDIKINEHGIEAKKINYIEINDEFAEALELLKHRYPSCVLPVEKRLMKGTSYETASLVNRRCPTVIQMLFRETVAGVIRAIPILVPVAGVTGPSIAVPSIILGK
jgi:hypothetical protein